MNENTKQDTEAILSLAMDIGKSMIKCGAEIDRVEETIIRICHAYGMKKTEVFSIVSMINVTTVDPDGHAYTQSRRVYSYSTNLGRLERLNSLSRSICCQAVSFDEAREILDTISGEKNGFHTTACIGSVLAAGGFAVFFGGTWKDCLAAMPIAVMIYLMNTYIKARGMSKLFYTALCSIVSGFLAIFFVRIGFGDNPAMIMIGDIMLIIPGVTLINSIREMLCGDLMSGMLRLLESLILSITIACGFSIPILICAAV